ncbi:uncharacterized protein LOC120343284 [Styela clava]|uniref:uncharacterized protein LOC120343284 n=1 Tax=Styela clava TaxID=7725 RepID=UPI0019395D41|nr:uncharacterized protein LOC120343284 [Styela clava]
MNLLKLIFPALSLVICASASCLIKQGCYDDGIQKEYRIGSTWKSFKFPCKLCTCFIGDPYLVTCTKTTTPVSLKEAAWNRKNLKTAEFMLTKLEAMGVQCSPETNPVSSQYLANTYHYFSQKYSRCCDRFHTFTQVPLYCKLVHINRCKTQLVYKEDTSKTCLPETMALTG